MSEIYDCGICGEAVSNDQYIVHQMPESYAVYHSDCWNRDMINELVQKLEALAEKWESSGMVEDEACAMELREVLEGYK